MDRTRKYSGWWDCSREELIDSVVARMASTTTMTKL